MKQQYLLFFASLTCQLWLCITRNPTFVICKQNSSREDVLQADHVWLPV